MSKVAATDSDRGWSVRELIASSRRVTQWTFAGLRLALLTASLFLISWLANYNPLSWDLTEGRLYSISEQSAAVLETLRAPVELIAFVPGGRDSSIERVLKAYGDSSSLVSYRLVDPEARPALATKYQVREHGTLVAVGSDRVRKASSAEEPAITNAILGVDRGAATPVCFLTGHGERGLGIKEQQGMSAAATALTQTNYEVRALNLAAAEQVPSECVLVAVAGPTGDVIESEASALRSYLDNGGRLLALLESRVELPLLSGLLAEYGIRVNDDFVIDTGRNGQAVRLGIQVPMVDTYAEHPITENFRLMTFYNMPRSLTVADNPPEGLDVRPLASTTRSSWGETTMGEAARYDEGVDRVGPLPLVVAVSEAVEETAGAYRARMRAGEPAPIGEPILVAVGDVDFASNALFHFQGDGDLLLNSVNWLAGEQELISIMPKKVANKRIVMDEAQKAMAFVGLVLLLPALPAVAGVIMMLRKAK